MERWVSLARESSLAQGQSKMFTLEDLQLAVFRVEGGESEAERAKKERKKGERIGKSVPGVGEVGGEYLLYKSLHEMDCVVCH